MTALMFSDDLIAQLAAELHESEKSRVQIEHFSKRHPGMTIADGYAISRAWVAMKIAEGVADIGIVAGTGAIGYGEREGRATNLVEGPRRRDADVDVDAPRPGGLGPANQPEVAQRRLFHSRFSLRRCFLSLSARVPYIQGQEISRQTISYALCMIRGATHMINTTSGRITPNTRT